MSEPKRHRVSSRRARRARRAREGAAALEFALILPLFVFLVLALIDFGHMLFVVNTITNAAREGARRGVVMRDASSIVSTAQSGATAYLTAARLSNTATVTATRNGNDVVVTVTVSNYRPISGFSYVVPGISASNLANSRTLSATSTMRWEFATSGGT